MEDISFFAHEAEMARMERVNKRLWVLLIIMLVAFIVTNVIWAKQNNIGYIRKEIERITDDEESLEDDEEQDAYGDSDRRKAA